MRDDNFQPAVHKSKTWLVRGFAVAALCVAVAIGWKTYLVCQRGGVAVAQSRAASQPDKPAISEKVPHAATPDRNSTAAVAPETTSVAEGESFEQRILGTWQDTYQGKRTMHLKPDGTGTMLVELEGWNATLFASRLTFEMVWSIEGNRLTKRTVGGEPEGRVKAVLAMMGDQVEEEIIELTDERLLVKEVDSQKQFDWRRAAE